MFIFFIPLILFSSVLFTRLNHPLSMGLTLFSQTILICLSSGYYSHSFWFSYILFLIFLGGMLVLFIYVASLASNEMFNTQFNYLSISLSLVFILSFMLLFFDPLTIYSNFNLLASSVMSMYKFNMTSLLVSTIYNYSSMFFTLFLISYLLLTLFIVVKIINPLSSPLRTNN
uniref:NADH-ubiquinone oxidoreductase chain 6 n=1 Tax=Austropotamobius torrentium TaxID=94942 RepID=A0A1L6V0A1_AUSTO|nr:NADH dehydrogenase subunit 6 [Austropotamobius torrentium]APS87216.1 NADH dehydrogenase subunit 6 [Austropotamobius torrentium]